MPSGKGNRGSVRRKNRVGRGVYASQPLKRGYSYKAEYKAHKPPAYGQKSPPPTPPSKAKSRAMSKQPRFKARTDRKSRKHTGPKGSSKFKNKYQYDWK